MGCGAVNFLGICFFNQVSLSVTASKGAGHFNITVCKTLGEAEG
jgi:hypothetical protein